MVIVVFAVVDAAAYVVPADIDALTTHDPAPTAVTAPVELLTVQIDAELLVEYNFVPSVVPADGAATTVCDNPTTVVNEVLVVNARVLAVSAAVVVHVLVDV